MATAMDKTRSIELPNELWQRVFFFASQNTISSNDYVKLWTSVRAVSRSWRAIITREYLDAYIKDPERCLIYWNAGGDWVPDIEAGMIHHFELEMTFDRFDKDTNGEEDKTRVVFRETKNTRCIPVAWPQKTKVAHKRKKIRAWRKKIETYLGTESFGYGEGDGFFEETAHVICLYGQANDTVLPGLRFDTDTFEVSFEWEPMLVAFMNEAAELERRNSEIRKPVENLVICAHRTPSELLTLLKSLNNKVDKARRNLRRERIQRHYIALDDIWADRRFIIDEKKEAAIVKRISSLAGKGADDQLSRVAEAWPNSLRDSDEDEESDDEDEETDQDEDTDDEEDDEEDTDTSDASTEDGSDGDMSMDEMIDLDDVETGEEGDINDSDEDIFDSEDGEVDEEEEDDDDESELSMEGMDGLNYPDTADDSDNAEESKVSDHWNED